MKQTFRLLEVKLGAFNGDGAGGGILGSKLEASQATVSTALFSWYQYLANFAFQQGTVYNCARRCVRVCVILLVALFSVRFQAPIIFML